MTKQTIKLWWLMLAWSVIGMMVLSLIIMSVIAGWLIYSKNRILPGVTIASQKFEYLTQDEALSKLREISQKTNRSVIVQDGDKKWELNWMEIGFNPDLVTTTKNAAEWGKTFPTLLSLVKLTNGNVEIPLIYTLDEKKLDEQINQIAQKIDSAALDPDVQVMEDKTINIVQGTFGRTLDQSELKRSIKSKLANLDTENVIQTKVKEDDRRVPDEILVKAKERAEKWLTKSVKLKLDDQEFEWKGEFIAGLVGARTVYDESKLAQASDVVAQSVSRPARDAVFTFDEEKKRVKEFKPEADGLELQREAFINTAMRELMLLESSSTSSAELILPVTKTKPSITVSNINDLGIKERIGRGESYFKGSITSRMHNIEVAASRLQGIIIPPGEEFSFINAVGEISQKTGYQQAYVILNGQTVLGDGGGVCQVSSTIFRSALNTGLEITKRNAHSYRVSYYEQKAFPGLDATVYPPSVDLKFKNDTPAHILVQTEFDEANAHLIIDFYGTSDGRVSEISNNRMWDVISPAPDLYIDDPTLPVGVVRQQEHRINGAKAAFDWKVTRNGEVLYEKTFLSVYRPWQAVYLKGTKTG